MLDTVWRTPNNQRRSPLERDMGETIYRGLEVSRRIARYRLRLKAPGQKGISSKDFSKRTLCYTIVSFFGL